MFNNTNLIIRIVIAILTFITSGFMIFLLLRYVLNTNTAIENLIDSIQHLIDRAHSPIVNLISRPESINSIDIALDAIESGTINTITSLSNSPVPSSNIIHNAITPIPNIRISTTSSLLNHISHNNGSINQDVNTLIDTLFNRRTAIVTIIGLGFFLSINVSVDLYLFVATPCC
jgi:hypothetical protein